jgi:predicted RNA methylase
MDMFIEKHQHATQFNNKSGRKRERSNETITQLKVSPTINDKKHSTNTLDQYYTKPEMARQCVAALASMNYTFDLILDPSAGTGSFLPALRDHFPKTRVLAHDIDPKRPFIKKSDFLDERDWSDCGKELSNYKNIAVCTNPPFGSHSVTAKQFFKRASTFASVIAFVLSAAFGKKHTQDSIDRYWFLVHQVDFLNESFETEIGEKQLRTVFQIWEKREYLRFSLPIPAARVFYYVKRKDAPYRAHIAIRQNGSNVGMCVIVDSMSFTAAGNIHQNGKNYYYIASAKLVRFSAKQQFRDQFNQLSWPSACYTVGHKSLGKNELTESIDEQLQNLQFL